MMRSLFSGVAGLKTHQTRMDVIGNNIANVNTAGFKASNVVFADVFYQTTQSASGANKDTNTGGIDPKQIGLGSAVNAISKNIGESGGSQTTNNAFDCMITGSNFFVVKNNQGTLFTKAGHFTTDADGTLVTPDGAKVQGWMATQDTKTKQMVINPKAVEDLTIMSATNSYCEPEATTETYLSGNIDKNDTQVKNDGRNFQINFYDKLGYEYTAKFKMVQSDRAENSYYCTLTDIVHDGNSIFSYKDSNTGNYTLNSTANGKSLPRAIISLYSANDTANRGKVLGTANTNVPTGVNEATGELSWTSLPSFQLVFNNRTGKFDTVRTGVPNGTGTALAGDDGTLATAGAGIPKVWLNISDPNNVTDAYESVAIDLSPLTMYANSDSTSIESTMGDTSGNNKGCTKGTMTGTSIDQSGKIYGNYDNGKQKLLAQIATTAFKNPGGLEAVGTSYFKQTQNSGTFDGIGKDVTAAGGKIRTGMLEMRNVDLAGQFTDMITTQRGFQANSRIITVSDTLLEELVNLKR